MGYVVDIVTEAHERKHGCVDADCDIAITVDASFAAAELVSTMRRNPYAVWCSRRGCGHSGSVHGTLGCMTEGCECEHLQER